MTKQNQEQDCRRCKPEELTKVYHVVDTARQVHTALSDGQGQAGHALGSCFGVVKGLAA